MLARTNKTNLFQILPQVSHQAQAQIPIRHSVKAAIERNNLIVKTMIEMLANLRKLFKITIKFYNNRSYMLIKAFLFNKYNKEEEIFMIRTKFFYI